jgi:hypothetical protein
MCCDDGDPRRADRRSSAVPFLLQAAEEGVGDRYPQQDFCCWIGGHGTLP